MRGMHGVIKESFKENFSNMSAPMFLRENARCAILLISSLLATLDMIPVLKTPFKESFSSYTWHMQSVKESLKRVFPICQPP